MFGQLKVTTILKLSELQTLEEAVAKLLQFADYPNVVRWFQFPTALACISHHGSGRAGLQPRRYKAFLITPVSRAPRSPAGA
jgi:hypothetical protein